MKKIAVLFCFCLFWLGAQNPPKDYVPSLQKKMIDYYYNARYDSAMHYVSLLIHEFEKRQDFVNRFNILNYHIRSVSLISGLEDGRNVLDEYQKLYEDCFPGDSVKYALLLDEEGNLAYEANEFEKALQLFERSLGIKQRNLPATDTLIASTYAALGGVYYFLDQEENSFEYYNKSLDIRKRVMGDDHIVVAVNYFQRALSRTSQKDSSKKDYYQVIQTINKLYSTGHRINVAAFNNLSTIYYEEGNLDSFLLFLNKAIDYNLRVKNERALSINYTNKARYLQSIGDKETAMQFTRMAEGMLLKDSVRNAHILANLYDQLGSEFQLMGRIQEAYYNFEKAGQIKMDLFGEDSPAAAQYFYNIAGIFEIKKNYSRAYSLYQKTIDLLEHGGNSDEILIPHAYLDQAKILKQAGKWTQALERIYNAMGLYKKSVGEHHKFSIECQYTLADVLWAKGALQQALSVIQNCVSVSFQPAWKYESELEIPAETELMQSYFADRIMHLKARILYDMARVQRDTALLSVAKRTLTTGIELQNNTYFQLGSLRNQKDVLSEKSKDFELLTDITIAQYDANPGYEYLSELFSYSEDSKAFNLRDVIRSEQAASFNGVPDSLLNRERELAGKIHLYMEENSEDEDSEWHKKFTLWKSEYDTLQHFIQTHFPDYASIRYDLSSISFNQAQNQLDSTTCMYIISKGSQEYYGLLITRDTAILTKPGQVQMLDACLEDLHMHMEKDNCVEFGNVAYYLYEQLFAQNAEEIKQQMIWVPGQKFHMLNPEMLLTSPLKPDGHCAYDQMQFLIESTEIWVSHSLTILMGRDHTKNNSNLYTEIAGIAPFGLKSDTDECLNKNGKKMIRLPWAEKAVEEMSKQYKGEFLTGHEVEKSKVLDLMQHSSILHFGTHALSDFNKPLQSGLVLACQPDETQNTYQYISAADLYSMRIPAKLTVLTACQTGSGKYESGEGVISLAHAFNYAGCPSTIMTLWSIDDQSSSAIALSFYKQLEAGLPFSTALRLAKLEYLRSGQQGLHNPVFWSGMVLIGQNETWIPSSQSLWQPWLLCILGILAILIWTVWRYQHFKTTHSK